jgi:thymidylate synthase
MNHFEQTKLQLSRSTKKLPNLKISKRRSDINKFRFEDFEITDYDPYPNISAPVAV